MKRRLPSSGTSTIFMLSQTASTHSFSWSDWGLFFLLSARRFQSLPEDVHCLPVLLVSYLSCPPLPLLDSFIISSNSGWNSGGSLSSPSRRLAKIRKIPLLLHADINGCFIQNLKVTGMLVSGTMWTQLSVCSTPCTCCKENVSCLPCLFSCQHLPALCAAPLPASFACQVRWCQSTKVSCMKLTSTVSSWILTTRPTATCILFVCACIAHIVHPSKKCTRTIPWYSSGPSKRKTMFLKIHPFCVSLCERERERDGKAGCECVCQTGDVFGVSCF